MIDIVYGYCVRHGGVGRVISEIFQRIGCSKKFRILTMECTIPLPDYIEIELIKCNRNRKFMSIAENLDFSNAVKTKVKGTPYGFLHSFGVYNLTPNLYTAQICLAAYFESIAEILGTKLSEDIPNWKEMLNLEKQMMANLTEKKIVVPARKVAIELSNNYGFDFNRIEVIHNASRFPISKFCNGIRDLDGRYRLGFMGSVLHAKGLIFLTEVLNQLNAELPIEAIGVVHNKKAIEYLLKKARFSLTLNPKDELSENFYTSLDCFVSLSIYEAHSLSLIEAMSLGIPVVFGKNSGNYQDIAGQGLTLATVDDPTNIKKVKDLLAKVLQDKVYRTEIVQSGLTIASMYNWKEAATQYSKIYESL